MSVQNVSASEFAQKMHQNEDLLVVDLRTSAEVATECLENCLHLPVQEITPERLQKQMRDKGIAANTPVYLLCQSGKRATMAVEKLASCSDLSLVVLDGGLNAIKAQGTPLQRGTRNVMSLERQVRLTTGLLVVLGVALGFTVHSGFYLLSAFVGAGLVFAGITDTCAMAMILARMPWNTKA